MDEYLVYKLYIDGNWVKPGSGVTFTSVNPANPDDIVGVFQQGNAGDVDKAVDAAQKAFENWSAMPALRRGLLPLNIAKRLREHKEDLARNIASYVSMLAS